MAVLSTLFSVISIVLSVVTVMTQKLIIKHQKILIFEFDVKSKEIKRGMQLKISSITKCIAAILDVHVGSVDVEEGRYLSAGGFHMKVRIDIDDIEKGTEYLQKLQLAMDNGHFAENFQECWRLPEVPTFAELRCTNQNMDVEVQDLGKEKEDEKISTAMMRIGSLSS